MMSSRGSCVRKTVTKITFPLVAKITNWNGPGCDGCIDTSGDELTEDHKKYNELFSEAASLTSQILRFQHEYFD